MSKRGRIMHLKGVQGVVELEMWGRLDIVNAHRVADKGV